VVLSIQQQPPYFDPNVIIVLITKTLLVMPSSDTSYSDDTASIVEKLTKFGSKATRTSPRKATPTKVNKQTSKTTTPTKKPVTSTPTKGSPKTQTTPTNTKQTTTPTITKSKKLTKKPSTKGSPKLSKSTNNKQSTNNTESVVVAHVVNATRTSPRFTAEVVVAAPKRGRPRKDGSIRPSKKKRLHTIEEDDGLKKTIDEVNTIDVIDGFNKDDVEPSTSYDEIIEETVQETEDLIIDEIRKKALLQTTTNTQQKLTIKPNVPTKKPPPIQNNISNPRYSNQELIIF
jgi:hypothetical protein